MANYVPATVIYNDATGAESVSLPEGPSAYSALDIAFSMSSETDAYFSNVTIVGPQAGKTYGAFIQRPGGTSSGRVVFRVSQSSISVSQSYTTLIHRVVGYK